MMKFIQTIKRVESATQNTKDLKLDSIGQKKSIKLFEA